jgi:hypothetical protein
VSAFNRVQLGFLAADCRTRYTIVGSYTRRQNAVRAVPCRCHILYFPLDTRHFSCRTHITHTVPSGLQFQFVFSNTYRRLEVDGISLCLKSLRRNVCAFRMMLQFVPHREHCFQRPIIECCLSHGAPCGCGYIYGYYTLKRCL